MDAYLATDREIIRRDIDATCGKDRFNDFIKTYIDAVAANVRRPCGSGVLHAAGRRLPSSP